MPIAVEWDDQAQSIIHETYSGLWSIEDNRAEREIVRAMLAEREQTVDMIVTLDQARFPAGVVRHFPELSRGSVSSDPRLGVFVLVGLGTFEQTLYDIFSKVYKVHAQRLFVAKTLEEARHIVSEQRAKRAASA